MSNANDKQVGGVHYQQRDIPQHWDIVIALNWDYLLGAATKYLWRLGRKGDEVKALEDLDKAIHYLQKKREVMSAQVYGERKQVKIVVATENDDGSEPGPGYVNQD